MSTVYTYISQVIVTQTGVPGSGSLRVGMGDTLGEALDNLDSTPFGCHESELKAIEWAVQASPDDLEEYEPDADELRVLDDEQWEDYKTIFGATCLTSCAEAEEDPEYETAESWYNNLGFVAEVEDDRVIHPVCPMDFVLEFQPKNPAEKLALDYALRAARVAQELEALFDRAVELWEQVDEKGVKETLEEASSKEKEYGDDSATRDLAKLLLFR